MMDDPIARIASRLARSGKNVFFTGAGISTESGIPDYRSKGGLWDKFHPVYFDDFMADKASRTEYWRQRADMHPDLVRARPNPAHAAIHAFYEMGLLDTCITQNIDGLHQMSGLPEEKVIELHGNTRRIRCLKCGRLVEEAEVFHRIQSGDEAPDCTCGGFLKPDTISFGQAMPVNEVEAARHHCLACDVLVVVGSTLLVQPAAHMPIYAKQGGAFLSIINLSETPCDEICDVVIREKAGPTLSKIADQTREALKKTGGP